ncbi:hypothetical protein SESBI_32124 [Sesbania bispinosa]|nr:hypothetical protein SESBI_32124 [Sesbania bispinosa]
MSKINGEKESGRDLGQGQGDRTFQEVRRKGKSKMVMGPTNDNKSNHSEASGLRKDAHYVSNHVKTTTRKNATIQGNIPNSDAEHVSKGCNSKEAGSSRGNLVTPNNVGSKPVGPASHNMRKVGLNLKSQVRFKNVKTAARTKGALPILSMPLMTESLNILSNEAHSGEPHLMGQKDDVEVFNSRPPDNLNLQQQIQEQDMVELSTDTDSEGDLQVNSLGGEMVVPSSL